MFTVTSDHTGLPQSSYLPVKMSKDTFVWKVDYKNKYLPAESETSTDICFRRKLALVQFLRKQEFISFFSFTSNMFWFRDV